jgi:hypothetical protein
LARSLTAPGSGPARGAFSLPHAGPVTIPTDVRAHPARPQPAAPTASRR